uniref:Uncharacterized protein n=1 Tax=Utricularia reniformis TaxID=192314 RepID=A0A1Y0B2L9_9LAMI|nr:hypothetical protein AEK19_MT1404 [Utricularia reniformis]ART31599.1 hypothetical protein AEK19_MT1404 [Utricularia reniformis]
METTDYPEDRQKTIIWRVRGRVQRVHPFEELSH